MADSFPNPLHTIHTGDLTEFQPCDGVEIVSTFGQPEAEYAAIRKSAALMDLPQRGVLELTGKDRHSFLNNLLTNQTYDKPAKSGMSAGQGVYAFYLNLKGRIVADMNVLELGDRTYLETDVRMIQPLHKAYDKYIFTEQVKLVDQIGLLHRLSLHGPGAQAIIEDASAVKLPDLQMLQSHAIQLYGESATLFRDDECGVPGFGLIVPADKAEMIWKSLLNQFANPLELGKRRLRAVGWAAYNAARIEAGRPIFDIDFGNSREPEHSLLPAETGQFARAVSVTKGCYLGQEIVARMFSRNQLARKLVGIRVADDALPLSGTPVYDNADNQIGMVTSSTVSPMLSNAAIALALIKKPHFAAGAELMVPAEGSMRKAVVMELPFVKNENNGK